MIMSSARSAVLFLDLADLVDLDLADLVLEEMMDFLVLAVMADMCCQRSIGGFYGKLRTRSPPFV